MKRGMYLILSLVCIVLIISFVSASFISDFFNPSGRASSQSQNVSINVLGVKPVSVGVPTGLNGMPNELGVRAISFNVNVTDPDGYNDINNTEVKAEFTKIGQTTRTGNCPKQNTINSTTSNFTCTVNMWYFDGTGIWNVRVEARDIGNKTLQNGTSTFNYGEVRGLSISLSLLLWPGLVTGATNQNASNDPTIVNNTANYNGPISITAFDLLGEANPSENITASSFKVGTSGLECSGSSLNNNFAVSTSINSNPGNLSAGGGAGQAFIYYCIPTVPTVSSQTYSTTPGGNSWLVGYV